MVAVFRTPQNLQRFTKEFVVSQKNEILQSSYQVYIYVAKNSFDVFFLCTQAIGCVFFSQRFCRLCLPACLPASAGFLLFLPTHTHAHEHAKYRSIKILQWCV